MTTQMTLFELTGIFMELYQYALEEDDQQAFRDTLEGLVGELESKAGGCVHVIKQLEMEADECDEVIAKFKQKKLARENAAKRIKEALIKAMDAAGVDKIKAAEYTLKVAKNGGLQPLVIDDEVPDNYKKVIYENDNALIRKALNDGEKLPFAHLEERGRHLNIQ